jgi:hypothetical protein
VAGLSSGSRVRCWRLISMVAERASQGLDDLPDAGPGALLKVAGDGQGGEDDGEVSLDRVSGAVEDRPGA